MSSLIEPNIHLIFATHDNTPSFELTRHFDLQLSE